MLTVVQPSIKWRDGLPRDVHQVVMTEVARVGSGLTSRRSAIMRIDEINEETAGVELAAIRGELAAWRRRQAVAVPGLWDAGAIPRRDGDRSVPRPTRPNG